MSLAIRSVRLSNFRAFESSELNLTTLSSVLIGANNVGKTSFFRSLRLMFDPNYKPSVEDVFKKSDDDMETLSNKKVFVDVLLEPHNRDDSTYFIETWSDLFGEHITLDDASDIEYVPFRAIISYDVSSGEYRVERKSLRNWPSYEDFPDYEEYKTSKVTGRLLDSLPVFYMDARRDIVFDMKDRFSYFARLVRDIKVREEDIEAFEESLSEINKNLVDSSEILSHLTNKLSMVSNTLNKSNSQVMINPIVQKVGELGRNLEISYKDEHSDVFPISNHGMGTRSWITFLTVLSYVEWQLKIKKDLRVPYHPIILLEEPEAHLHPNSQRNIYKQIQELDGQIFVSTHSPIVVSQSELKDMIYVSKRSDSSELRNIDVEFSSSHYSKIKHEILKTRGELLFSEGIILCEGQTEEQALPDFFERYFKSKPFEMGFNIVSVGGSGNKYYPFLMLAKCFDIPVYVFSDGERKTEDDFNKVVRRVFEDDIEKIEAQLENRTLFLPDNHNLESYLISEGYSDDLIIAIESSLGEEGAFGKFIENNNNKPGRPSPTKEKCGTCNQIIYDRSPKIYEGEEGRITAINDFLSKHKALYSFIIAKVIIGRNSGTDKEIPQAIKDFFEKIQT
ncbi:ATP-dependent nuclease [Exiguobacterium undae]|uniref:ATP-dependent endonuclease n=1 Tax=Exiguobacterium undae TaxID=169177 RepID=A0ABX2V7W3_9BACL|nr:AAA family ATPase [Exiguobacterium undae]OAN14068.1 hypothetical protein A3783_16080 [Exiguobacterium undae]